jgi:predicted phosphodiesterase
MHQRFRNVAALLLILAGAAAATAQQPPAADTAATPEARSLRIFFIADAHSKHDLVDRFIGIANRELPDLVVDAGDIVHDGTQAEFRRAWADRARLGMPWYVVRGNHDADLRGPFTAPPSRLPPVRAVDHDGLRIILLDNHDERLTPQQFAELEAELVTHAGRPVIVVMHVPPFLSRLPAFTRLRHLVPFPLASPVMRDSAQVARFVGLMEQHGVRAVLTGHAHAPDHDVRNGVHYIVGGTLGGLVPGFGIANEYTEIVLEVDTLAVRRVRLARPPREPFTMIVRAFRFYAQLNGFNHDAQGWNYVPSASVQLRGGLERIERGAARSHALWSEAAFERVLGRAGRQAFTADLGLAAARDAQLARVTTGYRLRPWGDYNANLFVTGSTTANAGVLDGSATAGVGVRVTAGGEWRWLTGEIGRSWATNHYATHIGFGYRY